MGAYEAVIGLEVHVQLATDSKLFCSCPNKFGEAPNTNVCEVCAGMPGALPSPNRRAIEYAATVGLAVNCAINRSSRFARKNYFYPDLPAGYQISQFELPICEHGWLEVDAGEGPKRIGITRIHMENDAGKNIHAPAENVSYVDLNRAGTPLVEIVSEPDMRSAAEAVAYLKALHGIVTYLGVSDGNMEEGSFRCDANVSIRPVGEARLGTRTELKNLNSFRNVQRAIEFEIARQEDILEDGGSVVQETRLYDAGKNVTLAMRGKEEAQDYRYFPDPDLLPVVIDEEELAAWKAALPELPRERARRFVEMTGLPAAEVEVLVQGKGLADFFEKACAGAEPRKVAGLILGPLLRECNARNLAPSPEKCPDVWKMTAEGLAALARVIDDGLISAKIAADIFGELFTSGVMADAYVKEKGLAQISDTGELAGAVDGVIAANPAEAEAYRGGKTKLMSFFVGQVMRATKGKANPALVNQLLAKKLS
ncbi:MULTISPECIES: Asp-tRNA(Asn)/Glu-tRNA(Gln) amidotransferase subunit GatB [unclassified Desulfovibrio]|uniref:Asp-tRNA(Asn)/Glu-tRNA(Gln) amidotransferase subunit GatB n=1 Tax=unclassified Desulfovibrio TaxID=2593640 RepID=UPI0013EC7D34|nr:MULTISPECIES: Asp-tRNA(Asn)/Glu-tRNA(Gln) amidotransferase subunit GatB [unclassified Desulfovibrio]